MDPQPPSGHPPEVPQNESEVNADLPDHPHAQSRSYTPFSHYSEAHAYYQAHAYPPEAHAYHLEGHAYPPPLYPPYLQSEASYHHPPHHGSVYGPQVGGGGEYRLRSTIKLSPNATKISHNAARRREEATRNAKEDHLEGLDQVSVEELMADWNPSPLLPQNTTLPPAASPPPPATAAPLVPGVDEIFTPSPRHPTPPKPSLTPPMLRADEPEPSTPTPRPARRPTSLAEHLFTPAPASRRAISPLPDTILKEAVFDALGFQPVEIPSPPAAFIPGGDSGSDAGSARVSSEGTVDVGKKGRPDKASEEITAQLEEKVNKLFEAASKATGRTVDSLVSQWHGTSKYGVKQSPWNDYQHYFKRNVEKERRRAGLPDGNANDCWQTFKLKANYQQIMSISLELEKAQEDTTIAQRGKAFKKLTDVQEGLVNKAARERVETFVFMAGSSVNEDSNLTFLFTSEGMEDFITKRLQMTPSDFIALAKTQIYSHVSDEFIKEYVAARGDVAKPKPPHVTKQAAFRTAPTPPSRTAPTQAAEDDNEGESEGEGDNDENSGGPAHSADDDRTEVKQRFSALFLEHNLQTRTFPWSGLLAQLLKWRVQLVGWPADVPFPSETLKVDNKGNKKSSQGIKLLKSKPVRSLLAALADPAKPIKIVTGLSKHDLEQENVPLIVCAAPPHGSEHRAGRRQFAGGRIDSGGPPALGINAASTRTKKKSKGTGKPPPSDTEIPDLYAPDSPPSARTRSHSNPPAKHKARMESDNDDDDDTLLVPVHSKSARTSKSTSASKSASVSKSASMSKSTSASKSARTSNVDSDVYVESDANVGSDDSDPEGLNAVDPHDKEFDMVEDDQSEVEVKPKSPKKTGRGKRKAEAVMSVKGRERSRKGKEKDRLEVEKATPATATPGPTHTSVKAPAPAASPSTVVDPTKEVEKAARVAAAPVPPPSTTTHPKPTMEDKVTRAIASLGSGRGLESGDEPLAKRPRLEAEGTAPPDSAVPPPSRAPSHAPSVPSRPSSRAPSAPPRVAAAQPPSARLPPHFYAPPNIPYDHPLAQRPPSSGMYLRGHGGTHPPYMRGGPAGRGRGGTPQPTDGTPYYAQRPAYGGEGYYSYGHNYPTADAAHHLYAPPYGYPAGRPETYPPYGFGEAGPSRYADRYNAQSRAVAYADENEGVDHVAKQEMDVEGWTEVDNHSNPAE